MKRSVSLLNETKQTCSRSSGPRPRPIHLHTHSRSLPKLIARRHRHGRLRRRSLEQATSSSLIECLLQGRPYCEYFLWVDIEAKPEGKFVCERERRLQKREEELQKRKEELQRKMIQFQKSR